jgi:hypothetical protein
LAPVQVYQISARGATEVTLNFPKRVLLGLGISSSKLLRWECQRKRSRADISTSMRSRPEQPGPHGCSRALLRAPWRTVKWYRYQNHRSSYTALRSTARRFEFEVSWLIRLTRQGTSPFGSCLTVRLHWQLMIRIFFVARGVATLSSQQTC